MPGTSSAIPERLQQLAGVGGDLGTALLRAAPPLRQALAAWAASGSTGAPSPAVAALAADLVGLATRSVVWADGVGDVGAAFALAGAGTTIATTVGSVVSAPDGGIAAALALPGGRALTLEELHAMTPAQVLAWFQQLQSVPGFEEANFRGVEGLLAAVVAGAGDHDGPSMFADPAFDLADATVLLSMQDGYLRAHGTAHAPPVPPGPARDAYDAAVDGWAGWFEQAHGLDEHGRDRIWAAAEERSVRAGEELLRSQGTGFGPAMMQLVPFTHSFRYAAANGHEGELAVSLLATVDLGPLQDRLGDLAGAEVRQAGHGVVDDLRRFVPGAGALLGPVAIPVAEGVLALADAGVDVAGNEVDAFVDHLPVAGPIGEAGDLLEQIGAGELVDHLVEGLVDPSATPPVVVRQVLDAVIGQPPPIPDAPGSYYLARLADLGYLPGLSDGRPFPGAVPDIPTA